MISIARLVKFLRISDPSADDLEYLSACLDQAVSWLEQRLGRSLSVTSYEYILNYRGEKTLILPVSGVDQSSLALYTRPSSDSTFSQVDEGEAWDWTWPGREIFLYAGYFYQGTRTLKVAFNAGWSTDGLPGDLEQALVQVIRGIWKGRDLQANAESYADVNVAYRQGLLAFEDLAPLIARHGKIAVRPILLFEGATWKSS